MEDHYTLTDIEFVTSFKACTLSTSVFSHEAHLRLAWLYIKEEGLDHAIMRIQHDLKRYVAHWGAADKYNMTLTIVSVRAVYHFILKSKTHTFSEFIMEFPRLKYRFKELLAHHYKTDIFNSETAKTKYLEPELLPFD